MTRKSGCSPAMPNRLRARMSPIVGEACEDGGSVSICSRDGVEFVSPRNASTKDGAGAGSCILRGRKRHRPVSCSHSRAASRVRRASPFWCHRWARVCWSCSRFKGVPSLRALEFVPLGKHFRQMAGNNIQSCLFPSFWCTAKGVFAGAEGGWQVFDREMLHTGRSDPLKGALDVLPSIP